MEPELKPTLIIESTPLVTRWVLSSEPREIHSRYDLLSSKLNDKEFWHSEIESLQWPTNTHSTQSVEDLWSDLLQRDITDESKRVQQLAAKRLAQATISSVTQRLDTTNPQLGALVFLIPEYLNGQGQKVLHRELSYQASGIGIDKENIFLLFRSVALSLWHLSRSNAQDTPLLIFDCGHYHYEASFLEVEGGIPIRSFLSQRGLGGHFRKTVDTLLEKVYESKGNSKLCASEEVKVYRSLSEGVPFPTLWRLPTEGFQYEPVYPLSPDIQIPRSMKLQSHLYDTDDRLPSCEEERRGQRLESYKELLDFEQEHEPAVSIEHGWPLALQNNTYDTNNQVILGGLEFAARRVANKATYLEEVPSFEAYSNQEHKYETETPLVVRERLEGCQSSMQQETKEFNISPGDISQLISFDLGIRISPQDNNEKLEARGKNNVSLDITEKTGVKITGSVQPTAGGVEFLFKSIEKKKFKPIHIDWDTADIFNPPEIIERQYAYPNIIQYSGNLEKRKELLRYITENKPFFGKEFHTIQEKLLHPPKNTDYEVAFGNIRPENIDDEVIKWANGINERAIYYLNNFQNSSKSEKKYITFAGDTFDYATPEFQTTLSNFAIEYINEFEGKINSNIYYALGKICRNPEYMEAYLEVCLKKRYKSLSYAPQTFIWPFQKSMSQYEQMIDMSESIATIMFKVIARTAKTINERPDDLDDFFYNPYSKGPKNRRSLNGMKWVLAAILFGLRFRKQHDDFLPPASNEAQKLIILIQPWKIKLPSLAIKGASVKEKYKDALYSDLVIRFIKGEATEADNDISIGLGLSS